MAENNSPKTTERQYLVSVALPKRTGVYTGRGGSISTQVADVTVDAGDITIDAVLYGRLVAENGKAAMRPDLAIGKGVRLEPQALTRLNMACADACKGSPLWEPMQAKALARLLSGATVEKSVINLDAFDGQSTKKAATAASVIVK